MTTHAESARPRRIGFWRWVWVGLMILGGLMAFYVGGIWKPVPPTVALPAEQAWRSIPFASITTGLENLLPGIV